MRAGLQTTLSCSHSLQGHGLCENFHGHSYRIELLWSWPLERGAGTDLAGTRQRLMALLGRFDHKNLNTMLEFSSCENFCRMIFSELKSAEPRLLWLKVWEGEGKWAEWDGLG